MKYDIFYTIISLIGCTIFIIIKYGLTKPQSIEYSSINTIQSHINNKDISKSVLVYHKAINDLSESVLKIFSSLNVDAIIIDVPNLFEETEKIFGILNLASKTGLKIGLKLSKPQRQNITLFENELHFIFEKLASNHAYFNIFESPFVHFEYESTFNNLGKILDNQLRKGNRFYSCVSSIDSRSLINSYEEGIDCFISSPDTESYQWSSNPTTWNQVKSTCDERDMIFIPSLLNKYRSLDHRRMHHHPMEHPGMDHHTMEHPEMEHSEMDRTNTAIGDEIIPPHPEDFHHHENIAADLSTIAPPEIDRRSDLEYAWSYAIQLHPRLILLHTSDLIEWNDPNSEFVSQVKKIISEFKSDSTL